VEAVVCRDHTTSGWHTDAVPSIAADNEKCPAGIGLPTSIVLPHPSAFDGRRCCGP